MGEFLLVVFLLLAGMGAYWALVLFPRQRDFQKRQLMARTLAEGDAVITAGGVIGKIRTIDAEMGVAQVEIAPGVLIQIVIAAIIQPYDPEEIAQNARQGLKTDDAVTDAVH